MTQAAEKASPEPGLAAIPAITVVTLVFAMGALPALEFANGVLEFSQPLTIALRWAVALAVVAVALSVEGVSLSSLGFRRPAWIDLGYLLGTTVAALLIFVVGGALVEALGLPVDDATSTLEVESVALAFTGAITVGIVEEVLYRGYAIERLLDYSGSAVVAGGLTWAAFTIVHAVAWPLGNLVQVAAVSALFVVVYLRRRTLVPVVGAHVLVWLLPVLALFFG